jgi:hypothetical protein
MCSKFWLESLKERDYLEGIVTGGRIIIKWILGKLVFGCGVDLSGLGQSSFDYYD